MPREQQLLHFVKHARRGTVFEERRQFAYGCAGLGVDVKAQFGGKAHRAQHAHRVLAIAQARIADDAHGLCRHVLEAAVVIEHGQVGRVEVHRVTGEVAPRGVLLAVAKDVVAQHAAVLVRFTAGAGAKGRNLHRFLAEHDMDDLEAAADQARAAEQTVHLLRIGVGGDIKVLGCDPEQQVAHRAADHIGLVALGLQRLADLAGTAAEALGFYAVAFEREDFRLVGRIEPQHAANKALDQEDSGTVRECCRRGRAKRVRSYRNRAIWPALGSDRDKGTPLIAD